MTESAEQLKQAADDELVVATPHLSQVLDRLRAYEVIPIYDDPSPELGLTLLKLAPDQVAAAARQWPNQDEVRDKPLDGVLKLLYRHFEDKYCGWAPSIGKNRVVRQVMGSHNIGGGGRLGPKKAEQTFAARGTDPGRGVRVGIADTALYTHPWFAGTYLAEPSALCEDPGADADYALGHATFVAGLILKQAPGATLEVRRVLNANAHADSWNVAKDLVLFADSGLDVLNLSFGCFTDDNKPPLVLSTAIDKLDPRVVAVAAAGNHGATEDWNRPVWPAAFERVVAVGATDDAGERQPWSPDPAQPWVDVMAPGKDVVSTYLRIEPFDGFATWSGTSFATAFVSGKLAAEIRSAGVPGATALHDLLHKHANGNFGTPWIH
jgi:Subtilase family